eukprot:2533170-Lingulodinium_polyedra.AAC.1
MLWHGRARSASECTHGHTSGEQAHAASASMDAPAAEQVEPQEDMNPQWNRRIWTYGSPRYTSTVG